jgi:hypothetical protein
MNIWLEYVAVKLEMTAIAKLKAKLKISKIVKTLTQMCFLAVVSIFSRIIKIIKTLVMTC